MEEWKPKVGDWVIYLGKNSLTFTTNIPTQITFYGEHDGYLKLMTPELDLNYSDKQGWEYIKNFRLAEPHEIPGYTEPIKEDYKYLIPIIKQLNKNERVCIT